MSGDKAASHSPAVKRYVESIENQLGPIWYGLVQRYEYRLYIGTVTMTFEIPAEGGKPQNIRVKSYTFSGWDIVIARSAIELLRAPPIPKAVLAEIKGDTLQFEESFTIYPERGN